MFKEPETFVAAVQEGHELVDRMDVAKHDRAILEMRLLFLAQEVQNKYGDKLLAEFTSEIRLDPLKDFEHRADEIVHTLSGGA